MNITTKYDAEHDALHVQYEAEEITGRVVSTNDTCIGGFNSKGVACGVMVLRASTMKPGGWKWDDNLYQPIPDDIKAAANALLPVPKPVDGTR